MAKEKFQDVGVKPEIAFDRTSDGLIILAKLVDGEEGSSELFGTSGHPISTLSIPGDDFGLRVSAGLVSGYSGINKFGAAPSGIQLTPTDIWSRANATPTQQIWLAPTAARIHALASNNVGDNGAVVRVWGLQTWSTKESYQDVTLPSNSIPFVIIHRMKLLQTAANPINLGTITATAAVDGTITAVILPGDGQTEMAIYGVPSGYSFYLAAWRAAIDRTPTTVTADFELRVNERPDLQTTGFLRKDDISLISSGTSAKEHSYVNKPKPKYSGPCIIKIQATASSADTDGKGGFDGYIVQD